MFPQAGTSGQRTPAKRTRVGAAAAIVVAVLFASCAQPLDESQRLAALCQVWGFLKYYHPGAAQRPDWDDVLVMSIPRVQAAFDQPTLNQELVALIEEAGGAPSGAWSGTLHPALRWIDDGAVFEPGTQSQLRAIVAMHGPGPNRYVAVSPGAGNPDFTGDQGRFEAPAFPDQPTRLLALFRFWNMVQYFFPYKDLVDHDWSETLADLIPEFAGARDASQYHLAVARMTASIDDAHAFTWSLVLEHYFGVRAAPVRVRLVEERTAVTQVLADLLDPPDSLQVGDVVTAIDGVPTQDRRAALRPLLAGSNPASLERNVHDELLHTNARTLALTIEDDQGRVATREVNTVTPSDLTVAMGRIPRVVWRILPGNLGYVDMGRLLPDDVPSVMAGLRGTRGIVFDLRNYPNWTIYLVTQYLNPFPRAFATFQVPDFAHPGLFVWSDIASAGSGAWGAPPAPFLYTGKVAVLEDQETQSQAEFTVMALRSVPGAVVLGSQTAGADGNISSIRLPGGLITAFSGISVFYPDLTPTQRVGIVPDLTVKPTILGLRQGRDEVLEAALDRLREP